MAQKVESYEEEMAALADEQLQAKTEEFRERAAAGESLDDMLYEVLLSAVKQQNVSLVFSFPRANYGDCPPQW